MKFKSLGLFGLIAGLSLAVLPGCILGTSSNTTISGKNISAETFGQIDAGKTKDFVASLLGQPAEKIKEDNGELWKWHYSEKHDSSSGFIFIFASHNETKTEKTYFVQFKGDVVSRVWSE